MQIAVRETTVTPGTTGDVVVRLRISDAALGDEPATFELTVLAELPAYQAPALAQLQRETVKLARDVLHEIVQDLAREIQQGGHMTLEPRRK
ncbi:MAG TPA: hypothetical protein VH678_18370 [Xanthobacteraceae bacterium]|jgi:hypothetical protein